MPAHRDEDYRPTSGPLLGSVAIAVVVAVLGLTALDPDRGPAAWAWAGAVLVVVLVWSSMLRPRVWVEDGRLVLRRMYSTVRLPLGAVESVRVRQVLVVAAGGRRHTCSALGRSRRALVRQDRGDGSAGGGFGPGLGMGLGFRGGLGVSGGLDDAGRSGAGSSTPRALGVDYADYVESRLVELTTRAMLEARVRPGSQEQQALAADIVHDRALPEIALTAVLALLTLALLLLAP